MKYLILLGILIIGGCNKEEKKTETFIRTDHHFCLNGVLYEFDESKAFGFMVFNNNSKSIPC